MAALLMPRYSERLSNPGLRPAGALPVELLLFAYPIRHPDAAGDSVSAGQ
jgi:hypothetical protein